MSTLGIYIHVPFCGKKCSYCDFYSICYRKDAAESYVDAVCRNIRHYSDLSAETDTVYFGGGTPSLLSAGQINRMISEIKKSFRLSPDAEITTEANPNTITPEKLRDLRSAGINRLSLGIQSMNDRELRLLGRSHTAERAVRAVYDAAEAGFGSISCDLMIALPEQTEKELCYSIDRLAELPVQHISAYILSIEEGTPFDCADIRSRIPDDDRAAELYSYTIKKLRDKGFLQYEISNFAMPGFESRHNCRYWKCLDYIGIGPAAHSCYKGVRFAVPADLQRFIDSPVQPVEITDDSPCGFEEYSMLRLRLSEGLSLSDAENRFSTAYTANIRKKLPPLMKAGLISFDGDRLALTEKGFLVSNSVITALIL